MYTRYEKHLTIFCMRNDQVSCRRYRDSWGNVLFTLKFIGTIREDIYIFYPVYFPQDGGLGKARNVELVCMYS